MEQLLGNDSFVLRFILCCLHCSHLFVVVTTNNKTQPSQIPDENLKSYGEAVATSPGAVAGASYAGVLTGETSDDILYVAAVVAGTSGDLGGMVFVLGNGSMSEDSDKEYYNAPLDRECTYYTFVRAYASNHSPSVSDGLVSVVLLWLLLQNPRYTSSGLSNPIG